MEAEAVTPRPTLTRRRLLRAGAGVAVLAAGGALYRRWSDRSGERLLVIPEFRALLAVSGGRLYFADSRAGMSVVETPLSGGKERVLVSGLPLRSGPSVQCVPGSVLVSWSETPPDFERERPPSQPGRRLRPVIRRRLRQVPLDGSPAREVLPDTTLSAVAVVGNSVFWVRPVPDLEIIRPLPRGPSVDVVPRSDLMLTPLPGGPSRKIAAGLVTNTGLSASDHYVFWQPRGRGDAAPAPVLGVSEDGEELLALEHGSLSPAEWNGRFYWYRFQAFLPGQSDSWNSTALMSARLDGTDEREHLRLKEAQPRDGIYVHRGRLYCVTTEGLYPGDKTPTPVLKLNRLQPDGPKVLQPLATLRRGATPRGWLDGDYFYFIVQESHDNWLDWSDKGLNTAVRRVLYRLRILS